MKRILSILYLFFISFCNAQNNELTAITKNKDAFFIPKNITTKYNLTPLQGDDLMKVYNNETKDYKGGVTRLNDIRWQAPNANDAGIWILMNSKLLTEGNKDITSQIAKPKGVIAWNVYETSNEQKEMIKSMGIDLQYYVFIFSVDKYVGKIFVSTTSKLTVKNAYTLALEGIKATIKAAKQK